MYLDRILGSKTKINVLAVLLANPKRGIVEKELAREAGIAVSEVNRQMKDLVSSGLVIMQRVGKSKVYRINSKHFLFKPLKSVFRSLEEVYKEIALKIVDFITKRYKPKAVILFGSLAKGTIRPDLVKEPSDIDIAVVAKGKTQANKIEKELLRFVGSEIIQRYGISIYPIVISEAEYKAGLAKDEFIINLHSKGEVLYGEKPRRFG